MLKIVSADQNGMEENFIEKDDLDVVVREDLLTLINKHTGEIVGRVRPGGWMESNEC